MTEIAAWSLGAYVPLSAAVGLGTVWIVMKIEHFMKGEQRMDSSCSVPDCDGEAGRRGLCHSHYSRWWRTGDVREDMPIYRPNTRTPVVGDRVLVSQRVMPGVSGVVERINPERDWSCVRFCGATNLNGAWLMNSELAVVDTMAADSTAPGEKGSAWELRP